MSDPPEQNTPLPDEPSASSNPKELTKELMEFADIENLTDADLKDMEDAISENLTAEDFKDLQETVAENQAESSAVPFKPEIDASLEAKLQAE